MDTDGKTKFLCDLLDGNDDQAEIFDCILLEYRTCSDQGKLELVMAMACSLALSNAVAAKNRELTSRQYRIEKSPRQIEAAHGRGYAALAAHEHQGEQST